jgi:hypothetical protein
VDPLLPQGVTCAVVQIDSPAGGERTATLIDTNAFVPGFRNAGSVVRALDRYHAAMVEITDAKDRKELDAASAEACKVMTALALAVHPPGGVAAGAVCRLAVSITAIMLDQRRYQVLKLRVDEADDNVIPGFAAYLGDALRLARVQRYEYLETIAKADEASLPIAARQSREGGPGSSVARSPTYDASLHRLLDTSETFSALRRSDPEAAVKAYVAAHRALREAIDNRLTQTEPVLDAIFTLGERVEDLQKAFVPAGP